eukprot:CAMPEP_0114251402 /NCGR_PEP_ID=MMETSP0058-20121206/15250_1 /TAXON_ID=36894 /ORGANISM="Pyramimonas parkeae, CCMP726" /LENGTH=404 /DNA_ID=CAMNT_0001365199 /DNA_START=201 /DNA_END=1415 /DNA_ORIENTATION=+
MHLDAPDQLSVQQTIKKGSSEAQPPEEEDEDMKYFMYDPNVAEIARIIRRPRPPKYPIPKILPPGRSEMGYMLGLYSGEDPDIVIDPNTAVDPAANVARTSSKKKVSVKDLCAKPKAVTYTCVPGENGAVAYVYFLNNSTGYAVPRRGRDPDDNHTYFQYTYAAISQLQSLTTLPIVLLVTSGVPKVQREKFLAIGNNVQVREIKPMYERQAAGMQTDRAYHLHSFGKLEVLNPEWLGDFSAIISMDTDTFVLRAPDEVFCLGPKVKFAAAKRIHALNSGFNSGFFFARPSKKSYGGVSKMMLDNAHSHETGGDNPNSFGEQPLLNAFFEDSNANCIGVEYNCGGFGPPAVGAASFKCGIDKEDESEVLSTRAVLHVKLSQRKQAERLPKIAAMWRARIPPHIV